MTVIIDYGCGNLFSLKSSLAAIGEDTEVSGDKDVIANANRLILPGVGAFADAARKLKSSGLDDAVKAAVSAGTPLMGICLGMQLLFFESFEYGTHKGLGLIDGKVIGMEGSLPTGLKIPHIGWNALHFTDKKGAIFKYIEQGDYVYFVHSYYASNCADNTTALTDYGIPITAAVQKDNVFGCQFHPEKSGETGLKILKAFCEI